MTEIIKGAMQVSDILLSHKCCNKSFQDLVRSEITRFQQNYFPDDNDFIKEFYLNIQDSDPCLHISYIAGLFGTIQDNLVFVK